MVTFNRLEYTKPALDSVLALDYPNLRIVVFDNASTDGTPEYLRERLRGEGRATLIASNVNRGVVYPMNLVWFGDCGAQASGGRQPLGVAASSDAFFYKMPVLVGHGFGCKLVAVAMLRYL